MKCLKYFFSHFKILKTAYIFREFYNKYHFQSSNKFINIRRFIDINYLLLTVPYQAARGSCNHDTTERSNRSRVPVSSDWSEFGGKIELHQYYFFCGVWKNQTTSHSREPHTCRKSTSDGLSMCIHIPFSLYITY